LDRRAGQQRHFQNNETIRKGSSIMTFLKTILAAFTIVALINLVWDLQDFNYLIGSLAGVFLIFGFIAVIAKANK
jgi:uncharacterized ion transporter superfamily protein YfcC